LLTKDLIRFRRQKNTIKPSFIDVSDGRYLRLAEDLLTLYNNGLEMSRAELDEQLSMTVNAFRDIKLAKGLNKICQDRATFETPQDIDYPALRKELFLTSGKILKNQFFEDYHDFQMEVFRQTEQLGEFPQKAFYNDLPQNEQLVSFKMLSPTHLLERYNCSLVQSLLLYTEEIHLELKDADAQKLRRLFKYLKFFRLLSDIRCQFKGRGVNRTPGTVTMKIDGPVSLFENSSKYGLQLASFFPAVPDVEQWRMFCSIKLDGQYLELIVDHKSQLTSHYKNFSSYVPEEIRLFHVQFKEKSEEWKIVGNSPFMELPGGRLIFPDLSFEHSDGRLVHMELFHRWHMATLIERLGDIAQIPNFILGVDRSLLGKSGTEERLNGSPEFTDKGFLFRDFPGVTTVLRLLNKLLI
jgi:uncharacterized protein